MARRAATCFIVAYLGILGFGLTSHTVGYRTYDHMGMYFIVWDMFCGWSGWETRNHLIAEGASGAYYDVGAAPWGDIRMFGSVDRRHYDSNTMHSLTIARNVADHTRHEDLVRFLVVEESWAKKYNLPDNLWNQRYEEPKNPLSYYRLRAAYEADGQRILNNQGFQAWLTSQAIGNNPRLRRDMSAQTPFMTSGEFVRSPNVVVPVGHSADDNGNTNGFSGLTR